MAVAVNGESGYYLTSSGTSFTWGYIVTAGSTCLVIAEGAGLTAGGGPTTPSGITYNGVAMTLVPSSIATDSNFVESSIWYLINPPTGISYNFIATFPPPWIRRL